MKNSACKRISTDLEAIEQLLSRSQPQRIEQLSSIYQVDIKFLEGSRIYREAIKTRSKKARWIEIALTSIETRRKRGSIDSKLSKGVKKLLRCAKIVFQRREKHRHECNQACYATKDPNHILSSQKHLSTRKNVKHFDPKHTHTQQV